MFVANVPDDERPLAEAAFPGATVKRGALAAADPAGRRTRVLSVAYSDIITPQLLDLAPDLDAIVTRSDGFDHLPANEMRARGIAGYHLGDYAADAVAHYTLAQVIGLLRRLPEGAARTRAGSWDRRGLAARGLLDVTVGVLGTGRIGSRVARSLCALGARVRAFDPVRDAALASLPDFAYVEDAAALFACSDALTLHVPLTGQTQGMVDARVLASLPPGAVLVNTARGGLVDQAAVEDALRAGRLSGYAADVLPGEPAPPDLERFRGLDNVVLTPHLAAYDARTIQERYARAGRIAAAVLAGRSESVAEYRVV